MVFQFKNIKMLKTSRVKVLVENLSTLDRTNTETRVSWLRERRLKMTRKREGKSKKKRRRKGTTMQSYAFILSADSNRHDLSASFFKNPGRYIKPKVKRL